MSPDADSEVHRLLERRCHRAQTAMDVVSELVTPAREDLEVTVWNSLCGVLKRLNDPRSNWLSHVSESVAAKRRVLESMARFVKS